MGALPAGPAPHVHQPASVLASQPARQMGHVVADSQGWVCLVEPVCLVRVGARAWGLQGEGGGGAHRLKKDSVDLVTFCPKQWLRWLRQPEFKNNKHLFI